MGKPKQVVGGKRTPTAETFKAMHRRCWNKNDPSYPKYGGRGITVTAKWTFFHIFLRDMGQKPPGMTIERRRNNEGYNPENCEWATVAEQNKNRRCSINIDGKTLKEWSVELGIKYTTLFARYKRLGSIHLPNQNG